MKISELQSLLVQADELQSRLHRAQSMIDAAEGSEKGVFQTYFVVPKGGPYGGDAKVELPGISRDEVLTIARKARDEAQAAFKALGVEMDEP